MQPVAQIFQVDKPCLPEHVQRQPQLQVIQRLRARRTMELLQAEQEIDRLQEKANRLKATLEELGVTVGSLERD